MLEAVRGAPTATYSVIFDAEAVTQVDATGLAPLRDLVNRLRKEASSSRSSAPRRR